MESSESPAGCTSDSRSKDYKMEPQDLSKVQTGRGNNFSLEEKREVIENAPSNSVASLQVQNLELLAKVSEQEHTENESDDVSTLRSKVSQLQAQLEECRVREMQANFRAQQESYRVSECEEKITELENEILTLQGQNSELQGRTTVAEQTVSDMWRDLLEIEAGKDECETKLEAVKAQLKTEKVETRKLKAKVVAAEKKCKVRKSPKKSEAVTVIVSPKKEGRETDVVCEPDAGIKNEAVLPSSPDRQPTPPSSEEAQPSTSGSDQGDHKPPRPSNPERPHQCSECGKLFRLKRTLKNHVSCIHRDKYEPLTCDFCKKTYKHRPSLLLHITRHHIIRYGDDQPKCKNCGMTFSLRLEYERHFRLEACFDKGSSVTCEICCKSYNCKDNLKKHIKNKHVVHSGDDMLSCNSCGKKFEFKFNYDAHLRYERCKGVNLSDLNSGPVTCDICKRTFKHKASLRSHKYLSHSTKEPGLRHVCPYCGRSYSQKGSVNTHIKDMHSAVMQHLCFICGKTYNRKQVLAKHVKTVHGGKTRLSCSLCGKTFKTEFSQRRHMANIHRDNLMQNEKLQC